MDKFSENIKYQQISASGKNLFWKYGIKRVTVEEICTEAKVSKMTFYKFFSNKIELAKTILKNLISHSLQETEELINKDCPFIDKINKMLEMKLEATQSISSEFISDLYKNPEHEMMQIIEKAQEKSMALIILFLQDSQKKGFIRKDIKIEFMIYFLGKVTQMTLDNDLLSKYENSQDAIMEITNFFFYGIGAKK